MQSRRVALLDDRHRLPCPCRLPSPSRAWARPRHPAQRTKGKPRCRSHVPLSAPPRPSRGGLLTRAPRRDRVSRPAAPWAGRAFLARRRWRTATIPSTWHRRPCRAGQQTHPRRGCPPARCRRRRRCGRESQARTLPSPGWAPWAERRCVALSMKAAGQGAARVTCLDRRALAATASTPHLC